MCICFTITLPFLHHTPLPFLDHTTLPFLHQIITWQSLHHTITPPFLHHTNTLIFLLSTIFSTTPSPCLASHTIALPFLITQSLYHSSFKHNHLFTTSSPNFLSNKITLLLLHHSALHLLVCGRDTTELVYYLSLVAKPIHWSSTSKYSSNRKG